MLVDDYLQTNAPALAQAREALTRSVFRYPVDYSYGVDISLPHLARLRTLARAAALHAELSAMQGRTNEWPRDVEFDLRLAATLNNEPVMMSHLVRDTIISLASQATQRCLQYGIPADEQLKELQAVFETAASTNTLPQAIVGERAMQMPLFRMSLSEMGSESPDGGNDGQPAAPRRYAGKLSRTSLAHRFL